MPHGNNQPLDARVIINNIGAIMNLKITQGNISDMKEVDVLTKDLEGLCLFANFIIYSLAYVLR